MSGDSSISRRRLLQATTVSIATLASGCTGGDESETTDSSPTTDSSSDAGASTSKLSSATDDGDEQTSTQTATSTPEEPNRTWPQFQYDGAHTGNPDPASIPTESPEERWRFKAEETFIGSPVVGHESVYIFDFRGKLYSLSIDSGSRQWTLDISGAGSTTPALSENSVYVGGPSFRALDPVDGSVQWSKSFEGTTPTITEDAIYVPSGEQLYSLDPDSGEVQWQVEANYPSVGVEGDTLYISNRDAIIRALNTADGSEIWRYETGESRPSMSPPTISDGRVFVIGYDRLYTLDAEEGTKLWDRPPGHPVSNPLPTPAVDENHVYGGTAEGVVFAISVDGEAGGGWSYETTGAVNSSPAVIDDVVCVGSADSKVYAIHAETGEHLWAVETGDSVAPSPAIAEGMVFIASGDNHVYAYE